MPENTVIFNQGIRRQFLCHIFRQGSGIRKGPSGVEINLSELGRGEDFGEMALLSGEPGRHVETLEETRLIIIPKVFFLNILQDLRTFPWPS